MPPGARPPRPPPPFSPEQAARRNFRLSIWNGIFFNVGETFIDSSTVLTLFVTRLTDRNWLIGLAGSLQDVGWYLPQILTVQFLERQSRRLTLYNRMAFLRVLGLAAVTLTIFLLGDRHRTTTLGAFLVAYSVYALAGGFAAVSFYDVVGRTVPMERHARMWAYRLFFGGIVAALCAGLVRALLGLPAFSLRFGFLFAIATAFIALGTASFAFCYEPPVAVSRKAQHLAAHLRENMRVVWRDPAFLALYGTRVALSGVFMATPFYVVFAVRVLHLQAAVVAGFLSAKIAGFVLANLAWHRLAKRHGNRGLMRRVAVTSAIGPGLALAAGVVPAPWPGWLIAAAFFLLGASVSGTNIAFQSLLLQIAPAARRPSYVGFMNSFLAPTTALPVLGGGLLDVSGPTVLFGVAAACALLAWWLAARLPVGTAGEVARPPGREGHEAQA